MTRLSAVAGAAINGTAANGILMLGNVLHAKEEFSKLSDLGPVTVCNCFGAGGILIKSIAYHKRRSRKLS